MTSDDDFASFTVPGTPNGLSSSATLTLSGTISLSLDLKTPLPDLPPSYAPQVDEFGVDKRSWRSYPKLSILIMIVGSRGDVQPYIALGKRLRQDGHRIRIATHLTFQEFVTQHGLDFFDIGASPKELMSYMVKNPGLIPGMESILNGDITRKRKMLSEMINGCWLSCHTPDPRTGTSFAVDAIIANPPAFGGIHCAEAIGVPLLFSFTMPWSPTISFPHPLVTIKSSNAEHGLTNYLSYAMAELLTWQGTGDLINKFRKSIGLESLSIRSGPGLADTLKVPWTYCMSPALVPKPNDWKNHIDVVGFYFLDLATDYQPSPELVEFLRGGDPPVYIGFGSVVVEDSNAMTEIIYEATRQAGVRVLLSPGWAELGSGATPPDHIFLLPNDIPHDWLFDQGRVSAVVHHGGAGTTAAGLAKGLPTVVVPFFGDQGFWGDMIHRSGAGPEPIPQKTLGMDNLRDAIKFSVSPAAKKAAQEMGKQIAREDGVTQGVESFYRHLPLMNMRCDLDPSRIAVWFSTEHCLKLSAFAAQVLIDAKELKMDGLDLHRTKEYDTRAKTTDPITGGVIAIFWTVTHYYGGIAEIFYSPAKGIVHTTTAIPRGIMKIVTSVHEGFQNVPKLYGSEVRAQGEVTDFKSGLKEAGKGFFYGYYDGITGLVREPVQGAKKEGFLGAIKGSARSFANVTMRPAAGAVGLVVHPFQGAWKSIESSFRRKQEWEQRLWATRIADGFEAAQASSPLDKEYILKRFREMKPSTGERKKRYREMAENLYAERSEANEPSPASEEYDEDVAFERDLEMAKKLSLAET